MTGQQRQAGFTLLEALVALVVISIGLLGLLGLQTVAIVNTHVSKSQTLASIGADDMADRIRANSGAAASPIYARISSGSATQPSPDCSQNVCSPSSMAKYDAWEWQQTLTTTLPAGRGEVSCASPSNPAPGTPCRIYEVTVLWRDRDKAAGSGSADAANCNSGASGDPTLRCYAIEVQP